MTFAAIAQLLSGQRPFYLYLFRQGGIEYRYTSLPSDVTKTIAGVTGTTWAAVQGGIAHQRIPQSSESARSEFPVTLPLGNDFARGFLGPVGINRASLTVWKGYQNDPDAELVAVYKGYVVSAKPSTDGTIELVCISDIASLRRKGLVAVIQRPCRHTLYGDGCRLDIADWQTAATVTAVTTAGLSLTVAAAAAQDDGYYSSGIVSFGGAQEMIERHTGSTLHLIAPIPGLAEIVDQAGSADISIAPGCPLTLAVCHSRFANTANFGGFPKIDQNPFDGRSID